jgi:hypothetical protein
VHGSIQINQGLVQKINKLTLQNKNKLNNIDLFMFVRFLNSPRIKEICGGDVENVFNIVVDELSNSHV